VVLNNAYATQAAVREPPPELDADMTASDLATALRELRFDGGNNQFRPIRIDADVRDYLVTALNVRHTARRT